MSGMKEWEREVRLVAGKKVTLLSSITPLHIKLPDSNNPRSSFSNITALRSCDVYVGFNFSRDSFLSLLFVCHFNECEKSTMSQEGSSRGGWRGKGLEDRKDRWDFDDSVDESHMRRWLREGDLIRCLCMCLQEGENKKNGKKGRLVTTLTLSN